MLPPLPILCVTIIVERIIPMKIAVGNSAIATALLNGNIGTLPDGTTATWTTSDETIATVTPKPENPLLASVAGLAPGTVTLTCTVVDHNSGAQSVSGSVTQTIDPAQVEITSVSVTVG